MKMHEQMNIYETNENYKFMLGVVFRSKTAPRPHNRWTSERSDNTSKQEQKETERNRKKLKTATKHKTHSKINGASRSMSNQVYVGRAVRVKGRQDGPKAPQDTPVLPKRA